MDKRAVLLHHVDDAAIAAAVARSLGAGGDEPALVNTDLRSRSRTRLTQAPCVYLLRTDALQDWLTRSGNTAQLMMLLPADAASFQLVELDAGARVARPSSARGAASQAPAPRLPFTGSQQVRAHREVEIRIPPRSASRGTPVASPSAPRERLRWEGKVLLSRRVEGTSRGGTPDLLTVAYDDLVRVDWDDGSVDWMTAETYARRYPDGAAQRRTMDTHRGVGAAVAGILVEHLELQDLVAAATDILGDSTGAEIEETLTELAADKTTVLTDALAHHLVVLLEDLVAATRQRWDKVRVPGSGPGTLYQVVDQGGCGVLREQAAPGPSTGEALVLLHGSLQPVEQCFSELLAGQPWARLRGHFGDRIFAWQHRPWSSAPSDDMDALAAALRTAGLGGPADGSGLVLLGHGRGGVIGELLCGETRSNPLNIARLLRVGAPVQGTSLVTARIDRFVSTVLGGLEAGAGLIGAAAPALTAVTRTLSFAMKVLLKYTRSTSATPGLACLQPTSPLVYALNHKPSTPLPDRAGSLYVVAGEARLSLSSQALTADLGHNLSVLVSKGVFPGANDGLVDTDKMLGGWPRAKDRSWLLRHARGALDHGRYYSHPVTGRAILAALVDDPDASSSFSRQASRQPAGSRGGLDYAQMLVQNSLERAIDRDLRPAAGAQIEGDVVFVPGIMGTHLAHSGHTSADDPFLWVDINQISSGNAAYLRWEGAEAPAEGRAVRPVALIDGFYGDFCRYLVREGYRVHTFPYDWRGSVHDAGADLAALLRTVLRDSSPANQPVHVVAHSMGGLVARAALGAKPGLWEDIKARRGRVLQGGTPNHGAPQLLRMLATGEHSVLKGLNLFARLTKVDGLTDLRAILCRMPGVLEMLPLAQDRGQVVDPASMTEPPPWFRPGFWETFQGGAAAPPAVRPSKKDLDAAWQAIRDLHSYETGEATRLLGDDSGHFVYMAGRSDWTVTDLDLDHDAFVRSSPVGSSGPEGRRYGGDGTVPYWSAGTARMWFLKEEHDLIFARQKRYRAMLELLTSGDTQDLGRQPEGARDIGATPTQIAPPEPEPVAIPDGPTLAWMLLGRDARAATQPPPPRSTVIRVSHGHLRYARWPVCVGHHVGDGLRSAGRALDAVYDGHLRKLLASGAYPSEVGAHLFVPHKRMDHPGVLVVGLGIPGALTPQDLGDSLRDAFVQYVVLRGASPCGISCLLFPNESDLELQELVAQVIRAVIEANDQLSHTNDLFIDELELIDIFEDRAVAARAALDQLTTAAMGSRHGATHLEVDRYVRAVGDGLPNHAVADLHSSRAHRLRIHSQKDGHHLEFELMGERARTEQRRHLADWATIAELVEVARKGTADDRLADRSVGHVLFHEVVPQALRRRLKVSQTTQLLLDQRAAQVPWELMRDDSAGRPPATRFVLTRQLAMSSYRPQPTDAHTNKLLVLADLEEDARLPGASREARELCTLFESHAARGGAVWGIESVVGPDHSATEIRSRLTPPMGRALHISAHGVLVPDPTAGGFVSAIALPGGRDPATGRPRRTLSAHALAQLDPLPQVVFLNTCHSGRMAGDLTQTPRELTPHPPEFAPDMAQALIKTKIHRVIVTGWEVDDQAAALFGHTFWTAMLDGRTLGEAALDARARTWRAHPELDTFGAYQVYGDATYRMVAPKLIERPIASQREVYDLVARVLRDLESDDQQRAGYLQDIEQQLCSDWSDDARLALTLGSAWSTIDTGDASLRALLWLNHAVTREHGAAIEAAELTLEVWNQILWRARPDLERRETGDAAVNRANMLRELDPNYKGPRKEKGQHEPMTFPDGDGLLALDLLQPGQLLHELLCLTTPSAWHARFHGETHTWGPVRSREAVRILKNLFPTMRRNMVLAEACFVSALWKRERGEIRQMLHWARGYYQAAAGLGGPEAFHPRMVHLWLGILVEDDREKHRLDFETHAADIRRLTSASPTNYWSRVVELDLEYARFVHRQKLQAMADAGGPDRLKSNGYTGEDPYDPDTLAAKYQELEQRHAPDPRARRATRWVHSLVIAVWATLDSALESIDDSLDTLEGLPAFNLPDTRNKALENMRNTYQRVHGSQADQVSS